MKYSTKKHYSTLSLYFHKKVQLFFVRHRNYALCYIFIQLSFNMFSRLQNHSNSVDACSMAVLEGAFQGRCASQVPYPHIHVAHILRSITAAPCSTGSFDKVCGAMVSEKLCYMFFMFFDYFDAP